MTSGEGIFGKIVGQSKAIQGVCERARRAAASDSTVLITGEAGTGKRLIAEFIHFSSDRKDGPFVTVNVASIPPHMAAGELFGQVPDASEGVVERRHGRFELADSGTIFIDEVSSFTPESQARLLYLLEKRALTPVGGDRERAVDVRVIAATSGHLEQRVGRGLFREDLYYRLNVVTLHLPPLRERPEDIPLLVSSFLQRLCKPHKPLPRLDEPLRRFLQNHTWPGNARQLQSCLAGMVALSNGDTLTVNDLPPSVTSDARFLEPASIPPNTKLDDVERLAVMQALRLHGGNRTHAAKALGISVRTLQRRLRLWNIDETAGEPTEH
jgi:DNA-binding NtrC family response regulator